MIGAVKVGEFRRLSDEDKVKVDAFMLSNARKELGLERWRAMWKEYLLFGLLEEFMEEDRSEATSVYYVRWATEVTDETEKVFYIIAYALRRLFEVQMAAVGRYSRRMIFVFRREWQRRMDRSAIINWTMTKYCMYRNLDYMEKEEATG